MQSNSNLLRLNEAAKRLNISRITLWKERKDKKITDVSVRGQKFIRESEIESYLNRNTNSTSTKEAVY